MFMRCMLFLVVYSVSIVCLKLSYIHLQKLVNRFSKCETLLLLLSMFILRDTLLAQTPTDTLNPHKILLLDTLTSSAHRRRRRRRHSSSYFPRYILIFYFDFAMPLLRVRC